MYGGVPCPLSAGESKLLPYDVGDHIATHLARHILLAKDSPQAGTKADNSASRFMTKEKVEELKAQIISDSYEEEAPVAKTEDELRAEKIAKLNKETDSKTASKDYKDKGEVMAELDKRGIKYNARLVKAKLVELLNE